MTNDQPQVPDPDSFWLDDWQIFAARQTIRRDGDEIRLEPKVMAVLMMLVENQPHVVTKTALLDTVWAGRFVVPGVLKRCVSELRRALGDSARTPRYIATVPTSGYRLVAAVRQSAEQPPQQQTLDMVPYRGLAAFTLADAPIYFGREDAIADVLEAISAQEAAGRSFCLITGPSGSGKSSLAQAGVMPALMAPDQDGPWRHGVFRYSDGEDLYRHFADTLLGALGEDGGDTLRAEGLAARLQDDPDEALTWLLDALGSASLLLLCDQLEELFAAGSLKDAQLERFFGLLYQLCRSGKVRVLGTIRNDFYPRALAFESLRNLTRPRGLVEIRPPGSAQIGRMIRTPARLCGLRFERGADGVAVDDLLQNAASLRPDLLPLLQFALLELYNQRSDDNVLRRATFDQLGGIEGCVAQRAESTFGTLPPAVRERLPTVLMQLVSRSPQGESMSRQSVPLRSIAGDAAALALVEAFINARLFSTRVRPPDNARYVQITHEALLRNWPRARNWLRDNARLVATRVWLAEQGQRWRNEDCADDYLLPAGKPLQRAQALLDSGAQVPREDQQLVARSARRASRTARLKQTLVASVGAFAVLALIAAFVADRQRQNAVAHSTKAAQVAQFMTELFAAADPGSVGAEGLTVRELLDRGSQRIRLRLDDQPQLSASLMFTMGDAYRGLGLYPEAGELLHDALAMHRTAGTATSAAAAHVHNALAAVFREQGQFDSAARELDAALAITQTHADDGESAHADTLDEYSMLSFLQRDGAAARDYALRALEARGRFQNASHVDVANSWSNLGVAYANLEQDADAQAAFQEALGIYTARGGQDKVKLAVTLNNLGSLAYKRRDLPGALDYFEKVLALRKSTYGAEHPDTASMATNLASVLRDLGRTQEAMTLMRDAYRVLLNTTSAQHPTTALTAIKICELELAADAPVDLDGVLRPAVKTMNDVFGVDSWLAARARSVLGAALLTRGETAVAEPLLRDSAVALEAALGPDSQYVRDAQARVDQLTNQPGANPTQPISN